MPIQAGRLGVGQIIAIPALRARLGGSSDVNGIGRAGPPLRSLAFRSTGGTANLAIVGVSLNGAGSPVASCRVDLFLARKDGCPPSYVDTVISDGAGNYRFDLPPASGPYYTVAVDPAGTLVGTTLQTLYPA